MRLTLTLLISSLTVWWNLVEGSGTEDSQLEVKLESSWTQIPFYLQLLESLASVDEKLYFQALRALVLDPEADDDFDDDDTWNDDVGDDWEADGDDMGETEVDSTGESAISDEALYHKIMESLDLDPFNKTFVDLKTSSKFYSPRIQSHYLHYVQEILPVHNSREELCQKDSFGSKITRSKHFSWLLSKDRIYCTNDDLFALQLSKKSDLSASLMPFDRVFGHNQNVPVLVFYGDLASSEFSSMLANLILSAESGKLRFVWRYIPVLNGHDALNGYGVSLKVKNPDFFGVSDPEKVSTIPETGVANLGTKLASHILSLSKQWDKFTVLKEKILNFPSHVTDIHSYQNFDPEVIKNVQMNERVGLSEDTAGIYINGAPVNKLEMDPYKIISKLESELDLVQHLMDLGLNMDQAKLLTSKLALRYAVQLSEYTSGDDNRYRVYENSFEGPDPKGGVVFINDIELDENYRSFTASPSEAYLSPASNPGQIPAVRENIHDLIFVVDLANQDHLKILFTFSKIILDKAIPQQIGILPLGTSELSQTVAKYFYYLYENSNSKEALALLYKVLMRKDDDELSTILNIPLGSYSLDPQVYQQTLDKFSITEPSVIFNGKIKNLESESWRADMGRQIAKDVQKIKQGIRQGNIGPSLKAFVFNDANFERNLKIFPRDISGFKYKQVTEALMEQSTLFTVERDDIVMRDTVNVWVIGDLSLKAVVDQMVEILNFMVVSTDNVRLRVIDTSNSGILAEKGPFKAILKPGNPDHAKVSYQLYPEQVERLVIALAKHKLKKSTANEQLKSFLGSQDLPPNHSFLLINSRYFIIEPTTMSVKDLNTISEYEITHKLHTINTITQQYPHIFPGELSELYPRFRGLAYGDWQDLVTSYLLKSFFVDDRLYVDDVARFDFNSMNLANSFVLDNDTPLVDVLVIIDPLTNMAQELICLAEVIMKVPFVRTRILLQPKSTYESVGIDRYYRAEYPQYPLFSGDSAKSGESSKSVKFHNLPNKETFMVDIIPPKRWSVKSKAATIHPDSVSVAQPQSFTYELHSLIIEGYARSISTALPPKHAEFSLTENSMSVQNTVKHTSVMANLGYFQFAVDFGLWDLSCGPNYELLSASEKLFEFNAEPQTSIPLQVFTMDGLVVRTRMIEAKKSPKPTKKVTNPKSTINIFTIASGELYEKLCTMMMMSVMKHTSETTKFWLIDDYLSPDFKKSLPTLSNHYNFDYEFVSYKWPMWLRRQNTRQRTVWGYKMLFLDVLFGDLDSIIFVDADQINRSDMKSLVDLDMGSYAYGFVPMCENREEMETFRFWNQGYWQEVLGDDLKYHISALFKVNLQRFKELGVGDRLRSHYQKLSSDENSLANLDQDLPNNLQRSVGIFSLPQEYLWCETWCSDNGKVTAKNIDLCSNPLTGEDKESMGRRVIEEWEDLETELRVLLGSVSSEGSESSGSSKSPDIPDSPVENFHDEL
ncbi:putative UDP-glucose:glycoprotein glucosyltransferase [[Candida] jaroonii]|uniref:UDP-glucose:glycoprotein glucosyltransferase n=1 Tax=[Candida] jaroonii TaxID=467808 RepID=A0ACA9YF34_9ASCO|nr:putative UDP-glucose:glycoprotein glucosyltransferase [[Candida] jaroonii]